MKTFTPHPEILELRKNEESKKSLDDWAHWLETTDMVQCKRQMTRGENTACCLHVLECYTQNDGKWFDTGAVTPSRFSDRMPTEIPNAKLLPERLGIAILNNDPELEQMAENLNDRHELDFKQIARLLRGGKVEL